MTKDSKFTRIADSASGGKGESMATEGRWDELRKWIDMHEADRLDDGIIALHVTEEDLQELLLSECSRLASRVEELEKCLREMTEIAKGYRVIGYDHKFLRAAIDKAEKLWAGAHAEGKE